MHTSPRSGPITKIGLHTNEGPEYSGKSAEDLRGYLYRNGPRGGGYQAVVDDDSVAIVQPDDIVCWANGGVNHESIDLCFIGYAAQTEQQWNDEFDQDALRLGAQWVASKCKAYSIPAVRLTPNQLHDSNAKGIFGHIDVSNAGFPGSAGHYDPGVNFPWAKFLQLVRIALGQESPTAPPEETELMIIRAPKAQQKNANRPAVARLDVTGKKIILMNGAKIKQKVDIPIGKGEVRGWYETFNTDGSKLGFTVMGSKMADGNPAFHFTWA